MAVLEIKKANKSYGGVKALHNCSFSVEPGRVTALIGPNGAGKTTLFNAVNGFEDLDSGQVSLQGKDITAAPAWKRSMLGMSRTFQSARIFNNLSIRDNLLLAVREDDSRFWKMVFSGNDDASYEKQIREAMDFAGLNKNLDAPSTDLSYGEQKLFGTSSCFWMNRPQA
jgi:branched-chain amino acid transport system ATP-binding protein